MYVLEARMGLHMKSLDLAWATLEPLLGAQWHTLAILDFIDAAAVFLRVR